MMYHSNITAFDMIFSFATAKNFQWDLISSTSVDKNMVTGKNAFLKTDVISYLTINWIKLIQILIKSF